MAGAETATVGGIGVGCELLGAGALHVFPDEKWIATVLMGIGALFLLHAGFTMLTAQTQTAVRAQVNRMEQSHFLLVALIAGVVMVAALAGAWWKSGSQSDAGSHAATSPTHAVSAALTSIVPPIPEGLRGRYFEVLDHLSTVLNKQVRPENDEIEQIARVYQGTMYIGHVDFAAHEKRLHEFVKSMDGAYEIIYKRTIPDNEIFATRLGPLMDVGRAENPIIVASQRAGRVAGSIWRMNSVLQKSEGKIQENELLEFLHEDYKTLEGAVMSLRQWIIERNNKIREEQKL